MANGALEDHLRKDKGKDKDEVGKLSWKSNLFKLMLDAALGGKFSNACLMFLMDILACVRFSNTCLLLRFHSSLHLPLHASLRFDVFLHSVLTLRLLRIAIFSPSSALPLSSLRIAPLIPETLSVYSFSLLLTHRFSSISP